MGRHSVIWVICSVSQHEGLWLLPHESERLLSFHECSVRASCLSAW